MIKEFLRLSTRLSMEKKLPVGINDADSQRKPSFEDNPAASTIYEGVELYSSESTQFPSHLMTPQRSSVYEKDIFYNLIGGSMKPAITKVCARIGIYRNSSKAFISKTFQTQSKVVYLDVT
ncbi:hypothetical protein CEXT_811591 [Caerostris extrusa]|uniref:Uncharacterized protein n=1 Tax=Caerostris extrusa TaxID=172846 RepID=A0AAV4NYJ3_CAEEX|nr:hypothetical protein CEXT_811591 [Caerostris extrusa]